MSAERHRQVEAIRGGTVIDHVPSSVALKVANLLAKPDDQVFIGVNLRSGASATKGVVKIAGREIPQRDINRLALIAPTATINIIRDYKVVSKEPIALPEAFVDIAVCPNGNCITNHEACITRFLVVDHDPLTVRCRHCERSFPAGDLRLI